MSKVKKATLYIAVTACIMSFVGSIGAWVVDFPVVNFWQRTAHVIGLVLTSVLLILTLTSITLWWSREIDKGKEADMSMPDRGSW